MERNFLLLTDSYKIGHHKQYPPNTTKIVSYFESRGGKFDHIVFFGLQYILKRWLTTKITMKMIDEAEEIFKSHFPMNTNVFNRSGWEYIVNTLDGKLPLLIKAVEEGSRVPVKNVLFTVENTDPTVPWITNYVETLLVQCWYPMTVCTNSYEQKRILQRFAQESCDDLSMLDFKLHDFGFRGSSAVESAGLGGAAHLVNFKGTDNLSALMLTREFYDSDISSGTSIPASEHSTMTSWTKNGELDAAKNLITAFDHGPLSIVADSYDLWNFIDNFVGKELKTLIEQRSGTIVIRPDSGDPVQTLLKVLDKLGAIFPPMINSKGYKLLPPYIRVIQGDGISYETLENILKALQDSQWSLDNVTFGSGGALLQKLDRDTQKCAFKCCMAVINDQEVEVFKQPITDMGKQSKKGNITLIKRNQNYLTVKRSEMEPEDEDCLQEVFKNGIVTKFYDFESIRVRAEMNLNE